MPLGVLASRFDTTSTSWWRVERDGTTLLVDEDETEKLSLYLAPGTVVVVVSLRKSPSDEWTLLLLMMLLAGACMW